MFLNDFYVLDKSNFRILKISNQEIIQTYNSSNSINSICVSQNKVNFYVTNKDSNTISVYDENKQNMLNEIKVGKQPWSICENIDGSIYVSNYKDNTVSRIKNNVVTHTIMVDNGPRDLCCDSNGNIFVSCYLSNTVCKIVDNKVTKSILVGNNPDSIVCDNYDDIYVCCYGSNTVSVIHKSEKISDIQVGSGPSDIIANGYGKLYVANYLSNTVTIISISVQNEKNQYTTESVSVGDGPFSLGMTKDNILYVGCTLDSMIYEISNNSVTEQFSISQNPILYGDCTGYQLYSILKDYNIATDDFLLKDEIKFVDTETINQLYYSNNPLDLSYYCKNNIPDFQTITQLPQNVIDYLNSGISAINMSYMFSNTHNWNSNFGMINLQEFPSLNIDTSKCINMYSMFADLQKITSIDLSNFDTSSCKSFTGMFYNCYALEELDLSNFDFSNMASIWGMFWNCRSLRSINLSSFKMDSSKTSKNCIANLFLGCRSLESIDLSGFETSNLTDVTSLFNGCRSLREVDISNWDTSKIKSFWGMFKNCISLESINGIIDMSSSSDMGEMFINCRNLTGVKIKNPPSNFTGAGLRSDQYTIVS